MKKYSIILLLVIFACKSDNKSKLDNTFYMPAEWEEHDAVWLGWSNAIEFGYYPSTPLIIKTLAPNVPVKIAFNSDRTKKKAMKYLQSKGVDTRLYKSYVIPGERYWIRDHGATFLVNKNGELGAADFEWDGMGLPLSLKLRYQNNIDSINKYNLKNKKRLLKTSSVDSQMAILENAQIIKSKIVHEGGAIEVNGKGTLIVCEATVLPRNPNFKKNEIEAEFKKTLGVSNIIWLKKGLAEDPFDLRIIAKKYTGQGTGGHTDEFVRFTNPNTILLSWISEKEKDKNTITKINYVRMHENYNILKNARDQDGKPFNIIKIPQPDIITKEIIVKNKISSIDKKKVDSEKFDVNDFFSFEKPKAGDILLKTATASYLNYLVTNKLVLLPTYVKMGSSKEKERTVEGIFKKQFPGRKIIFIDVISQNWDGGGLHCITQQQPKKQM
ncbi:agmatine deiminase family protein [Flavobacterium sp.]|uniref:agmatine deiminase family protein n=1 Tax=Flavobacterium sp. TaxID=239 RepID=UPI0031DDD5D3